MMCHCIYALSDSDRSSMIRWRIGKADSAIAFMDERESLSLLSEMLRSCLYRGEVGFRFSAAQCAHVYIYAYIYACVP